MYFEENLKFIAARYPHLLGLLNKEDDGDIKVEVARSKSGLPVPRVIKGEQKVYLNSIYDPEIEARRWTDKLKDSKQDCLVVYGIGFLYHLREILNTGIFKAIICYEPSPAILRACLMEINLPEVIAGHDVLLLAGNAEGENMKFILEKLRIQVMDVTVQVLPQYPVIFNLEINFFQKQIIDIIKMIRVNMATAEFTSDRWVLNAVENLKYIISSPGIRHFFDQFKGIPAVIISGGPSLEKNIHLLPEVKERALLICSGSSVRAALKHGVIPHFVVNIDGNPFNTVIYNDLNLKDVNLLYNCRSYPEMLDKYAGKKIYMKLDVEQFSDMVTYKCGGYQFGMIRSGFSVAHSALDIAVKLGCSPIILIGQDLAFTNNKRYAEGQVEQAQQYIDRAKLPPGHFVVKDIYGQEVVTDRPLDSFRILFERNIREFYQGVKIINATEGGQPIKGVVNRKLSEVIKEYCTEHWGTSWRIHKLYEKGMKEINKYGPQALCIPSQIEILSKGAIEKITELIDRLECLRKYNFVAEFDLSKLELQLNGIVQEYNTTLNYREYEVLLYDLKMAKMPAIYSRINELGQIEDKEKYDRKLRYWLTLFEESKIVFEHIREANRKSLIKGEEKDGRRLCAT